MIDLLPRLWIFSVAREQSERREKEKKKKERMLGITLPTYLGGRDVCRYI